MDPVLNRTEAELVAAERALVLRVRDAIAEAEGPRADRDRLAALVHEMDELFLLVVVGEYNSGKSTFINALLGDEVFEMGDLPTTRAISVLRYGDPGPPERVGEHLRVFRYPVEFLRDLEVVDTPGTNSLERMEEEITREFVPRADLVLFVTSLLQPLTASEMGFLGHIREWGKKTVFVVNGVDRRNSDEQLDRVRQYLTREVTTRLGGPEPTVYFISALQALRAKLAERDGEPPPPADARNEFPRLERYVVETLRQTERLRLKLLSPLGVLRHVLRNNREALSGRQEVVEGDERVLRSIREQLARYATDMRADADRYVTEVRQVLYEVERRGRAWLEDTVRIGNIGLLRNKDAVENRFRNEVIKDAPARIEEVVHRMVDWLVRNNLKLWTAMNAEIEAHGERLRRTGALAPHADTAFHYNREELFAQLRRPVESRLGQFDADLEAREIVKAVNASVAQTFGVNVLALGLGAGLVAVFTTAALDFTGVLTATVLAVAGWMILPARRRRLVREFEAKIAQLAADLGALLSAKFEEQIGRYEQQVLEVVQPYERFLETERAKLQRVLAELDRTEKETAEIERRVDAAFPEP